jgi:hypothetical protein
VADPIVLVVVHGWSVTSKDTYGELPEAIQAAADAAGIEVKLESIQLSRYISFRDEITMDDIARGMNHAVRDQNLQRFSCITHSTGGPLVRRWVDKYYAKRLNECPLRHLIMLAPANHGSALAILGKGRLGRIKAWFGGVEPGQGILDWLSLGSSEAWTLQDSFTDYALNESAFFPFVLSGETIDNSFYDFVNDYLVEKGSDGVVRLAGANLNYTFFELEQTDERYDDARGTAYKLQVIERTKPRPPQTPFGVVPKASHSGSKIGIMRSVTPKNAAQKPVLAEIVRCLKVETQDDYANCLAAFDQLTAATQEANNGSSRRFVMFIFRIRDDSGRTINDYDLLLLGNNFEPDELPKGFFVDRQKNPASGALVYYLDYDVLATTEHLGIRVNARPSYGEPGAPAPGGFAGYFRAEFRLDKDEFHRWIRPNETVYVDIKLSRHVDSEAIRFEGINDGDRGSFKKIRPRGHLPRD